MINITPTPALSASWRGRVQKLPGFEEKARAKHYANAYRSKSHERGLPSPISERGWGRGKNTKHFAKNYTSTLRKEGSPLHLERACPENREVGGEAEITKHHKMKT